MTSANRMIGVDVGGTFTDIFVLDEATGSAQVAKVPTSRPDQSAGFLSGIGSRVDDLSTVSVVVHGTTAGTNALLAGPAGAGKTTTAVRCMLAALNRGEKAAYFLFDERLST